MAKEVIIRVLGEESQTPTPTASMSGGKTPNPSANSQKKEQTAGQIVTLYAANKVWQTVKTEAQYHMGKYFNLTEDYRTQMMVNNAMATIDGAVSLYTAVKVGSAMGGPVGAAVAGTLAVATRTAGALHRYEDEATRIVENAYGNYFYGTRSGFVTGGHGTEN